MSPAAFIFQAQPNRVVFGAGTLSKLPEELGALGVARALVLATPQQAELAQSVAGLLGEMSAGVCARAAMHTPVETTELAMDDLRARGADGVVSVGGGSTIGLGKALAVRTGLPHLAVPTTYAGSEMTPILGETENGLKTTRRAPGILPRTTIYDVDLSQGLPIALSVTSGMNAIAHAVEALYAPDGNPVISLMAEEAIRSLGQALPQIRHAPGDRAARYQAFLGAWLAGSCLGSVSMSVHHKLCHTLGGSFALPHAETHTVMLPYVIDFVSGAVPSAVNAISRALGRGGDAASALRDLARELEAPLSLAAIGMHQQDLDRAAELAAANPYWSPVALDRASARALLGTAFEGKGFN